jgi:hypothetical protein
LDTKELYHQPRCSDQRLQVWRSRYLSSYLTQVAIVEATDQGQRDVPNHGDHGGSIVLFACPEGGDVVNFAYHPLKRL